MRAPTSWKIVTREERTISIQATILETSWLLVSGAIIRARLRISVGGRKGRDECGQVLKGTQSMTMRMQTKKIAFQTRPEEIAESGNETPKTAVGKVHAANEVVMEPPEEGLRQVIARLNRPLHTFRDHP